MFLWIIRYTYGQPVPGQVKLMMCRPLNNYYYGSSISTEEVILPECYNETKEVQHSLKQLFSIIICEVTVVLSIWEKEVVLIYLLTIKHCYTVTLLNLRLLFNHILYKTLHLRWRPGYNHPR